LKSTRHILEYILFNLLILLVRPLPQQAVVKIGKILGSLAFFFAGKRKQSAKINLDIIYADSKSSGEKNKIIKESFQNLTVSALQCLWVTYDTEKRVRGLIEGEPVGLELLRQCLKKNKGIFFLTAHYGNWEIMGLFHGYLGICPLSSIARKLDNPYLDRATKKLRISSGNKIIYRDESPLKIVRELKNNGSVAVMMDQNTAKGGVFVDFFGKKAATPRALALLSYRSETPILPLFCHPTDKGTYRIEYGPEIQFEKSDSRDNDILSWTHYYEQFIENIIRENPAPWMCGHRRWKTRPPKEKGNKIY
jgi:Kdo2-lipid IVA lauroyltransferase/acyltransferase